jgi:hypothetical protein
MLILPLQYENHRGPDAIGQHKLTFVMDESIVTDFNPMTIKKGTQFMVMLIPADTIQSENFEQETLAEAKERMFKWMHVLITDIAKLEGVDQETLKTRFKEQLKKLKLIQTSTKELTVDGLATAITILRDKKHEYD